MAAIIIGINPVNCHIKAAVTAPMIILVISFIRLLVSKGSPSKETVCDIIISGVMFKCCVVVFI